MKLPETVPILTARHIHRGNYDGPRGTHCLMGWALAAANTELFPLLTDSIRHFTKRGTARFNDDPRNSKSKIAAVWNKAMRKLGYVKRGNRFVLPKPLRDAGAKE